MDETGSTAEPLSVCVSLLSLSLPISDPDPDPDPDPDTLRDASVSHA